MTETLPSLGALRCATICCPSAADAARLYCSALGYVIVEQGRVSAAQAASWNTAKLVGAAFVAVGPPAGETTFLRFIEDREVKPGTPYSTLGWAAIEFTVKSSDVAVASLEQHGFSVIGPAQDLEFSKGALRAGQVSGPFGEILYLTQINSQIADFTLPTTTSMVGQVFIVISCVPGVDAAYQDYRKQLGTIAKDPFSAEVPFMADYHGISRNHSYYVGCVECVPTTYIELDEMPAKVGPRPRLDGHLPAGVAMVSFEVPSLEPFRARARGPALRDHGAVYRGAERLAIQGPYGEWIEVVAKQ